MKKLTKIMGVFVIGCLTLGALRAQAPNTLTPAEVAAGWNLLFDGTTLKGWIAPPGSGWGVADGAIFCSGDRNGDLAGTDTYSDFELKIQFKVGEKTNSGIFLRSDLELQIWDFKPQYKTGSLVNFIEADPPSKILAGQWNSYDVTAVGDHYVVVYNGKKVVDGNVSKYPSGVFKLQYHPEGGRIEFRDIKAREIRH